MFSVSRYGAPDMDLQREHDMSLTLRMSSVQYVHTKRFQTELVAFCQHFMQLQEVLGRMRAVSAGNEVMSPALSTLLLPTTSCKTYAQYGNESVVFNPFHSHE